MPQCLSASPNAPVLHSTDCELWESCGLHSKLYSGLSYGLYCRVYSRLGCGLYLAFVPQGISAQFPAMQSEGFGRAVVSCARLYQS